MNSLATLRRSVLAALRPSGAPWAVVPALWAVGTAALIAGTGVLIGELQLVGLAYLGAACAVVFLHSGFYRARWWAWVAQAFGGAAGISVGALLFPGNAVVQTLTAAVVGAISGMVGGIAPSAPAFGLMLTVGLAFGSSVVHRCRGGSRRCATWSARRWPRCRCWRPGLFIATSPNDGHRPRCTRRRRTYAPRSEPIRPVWPGARRFPAYAQLSGALESAHDYLREAVKPAPDRRHWQAVRADAYRRAHQSRATAEAAVLEPPPVSVVAVRVIPVASELEDTVDAITAVGSAVDAGSDSTALIADVQRRLKCLNQAAVAVESRSAR